MNGERAAWVVWLGVVGLSYLGIRRHRERFLDGRLGAALPVSPGERGRGGSLGSALPVSTGKRGLGGSLRLGRVSLWIGSRGNGLGGLGEKTASPDKEQNGDKENDQILAVHGFLSFWQPKVSSRTALVKIPDFSKAISKAWEHIRDCGVSIRLEKDDVRRQTHFHPLYPRAARFPLPGDLPVPGRSSVI